MTGESLAAQFKSSITLQIDYAGELNPQQCAAATAVPGPALVIAGAGSGKTRTLTYRVGYLLEQGIPPDRILLLTFTNKAAREMMRRVSDLLDPGRSAIWGGTFHSIANRILRRWAEKLGFKSDFTILDRDDAELLLRSCIEEAKIDVKATGFPKPAVLSEIFSLSLNMQTPVSVLIEDRYEYFYEFTAQIAQVHLSYERRKQLANVMDFDDLLWLWWRLMSEHQDVREYYQRRFQFILVDEYQDTNTLQSQLIHLLAARHHNVMAVGDDAQSIYSWRGANYRNILEFPERFPNAQVFKIETNYRSTPEILAFANAIMAGSSLGFEKTLAPARRSGMKPVVAVCSDPNQQAAFIAHRALQLRESGISLSQMAVLYRSHFHALELQAELTRRNLPFRITSGVRLFDQAHVKDLTAYLRFLANPQDETAFRRLAMMLPGVGRKGTDKLWSRFQNELRSQRENSRSANSKGPILATALQLCAGAVPKKAVMAWAELATLIAQLEDQSTRNSPSKMLKLVLEASYDDYLRETYENYRFRKEDLDFLVAFANQFTSFEAFLAELALVANAETDSENDTDRDEMTLTTVHQAKGLEFGVVFVIMLCDGLFPSSKSMSNLETFEEERRLLYVAVTRAKDELYLSHPMFRWTNGGSEYQKRSVLLDSVPRELYEDCQLAM